MQVSLKGTGKVTVKRLTAAGADRQAGSLWAGQGWEGGCFPSGNEEVESYKAGQVIFVRDSEAVVVFL